VPWVEAHHPVPERVDEGGERHRRAGMTRLRLLHGVDRQGPDGVDAELVEILLHRSLPLHHRVLPAAWRRQALVHWTPGTGLVLLEGRWGLEDGLDDAPSLLDEVLASEEAGIPGDRVAEHTLVSLHLALLRLVAGDHLDLRRRVVALGGHVHAGGKGDLR